MSQIDEIQQQLQTLPSEKLSEVLDFISCLQRQQVAVQQRVEHRSLRRHPAFGLWRTRNVDALDYQRTLRSEWDERA